MGPVSEYYELALYKLGWSLYKQELYDEALHRYVALLDYKVSIGYDFDAQHDEGDERRIADTFDIISLSFSNLGGPEAVQQYFGANGKRSVRGSRLPQPRRVLPDEAALSRRCEVLQHVHRAVPAAPALAALQHARDRDLRDRPLPAAGARLEEGVRQQLRAERRVLASLRRAAVARGAELPEEQPAGPGEPLSRAVPEQGRERTRRSPTTARRRAGTRSTSPRSATTPETPAINYQLADLQLENQDYAGAAREYERTAYEYAKHDRGGSGRLCRRLRASRVSEGRRRAEQADRAARHGDELAALRRCVPGSRARRADPGCGGRRSVRHEGLRAGARRRPQADRALSGRGCAGAPLRMARRRALVAGAGGLSRAPSRRYGQVLALTPAEDESRAGAGREPRGLDLQAGRARERAGRTIARRPITSCGSSRSRRRRRSARLRSTTPAPR